MGRLFSLGHGLAIGNVSDGGAMQVRQLLREPATIGWWHARHPDHFEENLLRRRRNHAASARSMMSQGFIAFPQYPPAMELWEDELPLVEPLDEALDDALLNALDELPLEEEPLELNDDPLDLPPLPDPEPEAALELLCAQTPSAK
jgi:hypothetical protein